MFTGAVLLSSFSVRAQDTARAKRLVVGRVEVEGNHITRRGVIIRETGIRPGQSIATDSVNALVTRSRLRLFNLQLFNEVEQEVVPLTGDSVIWRFKLKERWYIIPTGILQFADRNINTWWTDQRHDLNRVSAGLTITDRNFRGNLETLAFTLQGGYTQRLGLTYMLPYINRSQTHGIGITGAVARSRQTYFATIDNKLRFAGDYDGPVVWKQAEGGLCYIFRPRYAKRHIFQLSYRQFDVADTIVQLNADYFSDSSRTARLAELNYRFEYNGVDNWNYSLRGEKLVVVSVLRTGFEGLGFQAYAGYEAGIFRHLGGRWYGSAVSRGKAVLPGAQPYYFRNGLGTSTDYVRGYEYYVTDGYSYGLARLSLKHELFSNTWSLPVRYFTSVPVRIYPKVFFDAGYIDGASSSHNSLSNTVMYSIGAGVDMVTFYDVKIRVEFSRNHLGQNGLYLHFNSE